MKILTMISPVDGKRYSLHISKLGLEGWEVCLMDADELEILECAVAQGENDVDEVVTGLVTRNLEGYSAEEETT